MAKNLFGNILINNRENTKCPQNQNISFAKLRNSFVLAINTVQYINFWYLKNINMQLLKQTKKVGFLFFFIRQILSHNWAHKTDNNKHICLTLSLVFFT